MSKIGKLTIAALGMVIKLLLDLFDTVKNEELQTSEQYLNSKRDAQSYLNSFNKATASRYSPEVAAREKQRNTSISALIKHVRTQMEAPIPAIREAAMRVYAVIKIHGNISRIVKLSQGDKTTAIDSLLAHIMRDISSEDIATLNLAPWIDGVKQAQANFLASYIQRSNSNAHEADIESASAQRPQLEKSLQQLTKFIEAKAMLDPNPLWHDLSNRIDERITEIANAQRVKPRPKKKPKEENKPNPGE